MLWISAFCLIRGFLHTFGISVFVERGMSWLSHLFLAKQRKGQLKNEPRGPVCLSVYVRPNNDYLILSTILLVNMSN